MRGRERERSVSEERRRRKGKVEIYFVLIFGMLESGVRREGGEVDQQRDETKQLDGRR